MANQSIITEFWEFLKIRKRYWMFPIVFALLLLSHHPALPNRWPTRKAAMNGGTGRAADSPNGRAMFLVPTFIAL